MLKVLLISSLSPPLSLSLSFWDKVRIAYHSSNANNYFSNPTQRSDDIHLQEGKE